VRIWSRNAEHAAALASELRSRQVPIEVAASPEAAVRPADIIATVTASAEPILERRWLKEGVHINAVGSSIPTTREIDTATMAAARLFVDRRESALAEAGDLLIAVREGAVTDDHIVAELGDVIIGKHPGRRSPGELTLFKSLGLAVEDVASAAYIVRRARETGTGQTVKM
jgi:ornithine cyclodeaminase